MLVVLQTNFFFNELDVIGLVFKISNLFIEVFGNVTKRIGVVALLSNETVLGLGSLQALFKRWVELLDQHPGVLVILLPVLQFRVYLINPFLQPLHVLAQLVNHLLGLKLAILE